MYTDTVYTVQAFIVKIYNSKSDLRKCIFEEIQHSTTSNSQNLVYELLLCKHAFSNSVIKILNHHDKNSNIFALYTHGLKYCLYPEMPC